MMNLMSSALVFLLFFVTADKESDSLERVFLPVIVSNGEPVTSILVLDVAFEHDPQIGAWVRYTMGDGHDVIIHHYPSLLEPMYSPGSGDPEILFGSIIFGMVRNEGNMLRPEVEGRYSDWDHVYSDLFYNLVYWSEVNRCLPVEQTCWTQ